MDTDTAQEIKEAMKAAAQSYGMSTVGEKEYSIAASATLFQFVRVVTLRLS